MILIENAKVGDRFILEVTHPSITKDYNGEAILITSIMDELNFKANILTGRYAGRKIICHVDFLRSMPVTKKVCKCDFKIILQKGCRCGGS